MNKRQKKKYLGWLCGLVLFLITGGYVVMGFYYMDGFGYGTWVNGLYCTGKSIEVMNEELLDNYNYSEVFIVLYQGEEKVQQRFVFPENTVQADFEPALQKLLASQNPLLWGQNLLPFGQYGKNRVLAPELYVSEEELRKAFYSIAGIKEEMETAHGLWIEKTEQGFVLMDNLKHVLDVEKAWEMTLEAVMQGEQQIDLTVGECYVDLPETQETQKTRELWSKVQTFQNCGISYDMGDQIIPLDASVVGDWIDIDASGKIVLDENGELKLKENAIEDFMKDLASEYDTYGVERPFATTRGDTVMVHGVTYGTAIDQKAEVEYLTKAFGEKRAEIHIPSYTHTTPYRGKNDIGPTYIEIDMTNQTMYYYMEGELLIETPIVTGNMMRNMGTPSAVCFVYGKQRNRVLRGPNYASFVKFWMPVKGGIGIHDASWRDEYGGEIYKTKGSHGCINTPYEAMEQIYEKVEIGTPVIMFY